MAKIMIVVGHPQTNTLCEALGRAYQNGAESAGHNVTLFTLASLSFDPILHHGYRKEQDLEPDLRRAYNALAACDHLVL
ncbi:MAG: NAD(P)H-dependent oxidoreductase, partial [Rhizobiales bacterium]|nr:NAD(P)H-dependent oxidoreductase [Hyphomicrobiales bacterium]